MYKIKSLFLRIILAIVFPIGIVGAIVHASLHHHEQIILSQIGDSLAAVLKTSNIALNMWAREKKQHMQQIGRSQEFADLVQSLLTVPPSRENLLASNALAAIRDFVKDNADI